MHKGLDSSTCTTSMEAPDSCDGISGASATLAREDEGTGAHWEEVDRCTYLPAPFDLVAISPLLLSCLDAPAGQKGLAQGLSSMHRDLLAKSRARGAIPPCRPAAPEHRPALLTVTWVVGSQTPRARFTRQSSQRATNN